MDDPQRPTCVWIASVHEPSGHADEVRGFLRAQERAGHAPALRSFKWAPNQVQLPREDAEMLRRQQLRRPRGPIVAVHEYLPREGQPTVDGAVDVARVMFETDRLPARWLAPLLARDELWVPCEHNVEAFAASGVPRHKMRLLGGTLDFELFTPGADPHPAIPTSDRFTFLTNFDFSARKGWEVLLRAWAQAFTPDDGVRLVLKVGSFYASAQAVRDRIGAFIDRELRVPTAPIELLDHTLPADEMPSLYAAADAYVLASRGEGWGRPYMEAMAMGLPTIASAWGGNRAFMDEDTSWLVGGRLVPIPDDAELFNDLYAGHRWFDPDVDALAECLRVVAADPAAARARARTARPRLVERFGQAAIAARLELLAQEASERYGRGGGVLIRGRFGHRESLSVVNEGLAAALHEEGVPVRHAAPGTSVQALDVPTITHSWPPSFTPATAGPVIAVLPWEHGAPPEDWVRAARRDLDRVWVPSEHVREGYVTAGMPPGVVEVVPNGVDLDRFRPDGPVRALPATAGTTFLFVGGAIWRKGIDVLIEAWRQAFGPADDVQLVVRAFGAGTWYRGQSAVNALEALAGDDDVAPVHLLTEDLHAADLPALYRAADVLVAPYRAEGFCLPALEAMACGLSVIHSAGGPTEEFVPAGAGWLVATERRVVTEVGGVERLAGEGHALEPDVASLADAMRAAAAESQVARRHRAAEARRAAEALPWAAAADVVRASLGTLAAEGAPLVRDVVPVEAEGRETAVLLHVLLEDPSAVSTILVWAQAIDPGDPVTLVLVAERDAGRAAAALLTELAAAGLADDDLPDLALVPGGEPVWQGLALTADAVLAPPGAVPAGRLRRAPRLLQADPDALATFRAALPVPVHA